MSVSIEHQINCLISDFSEDSTLTTASVQAVSRKNILPMNMMKCYTSSMFQVYYPYFANTKYPPWQKLSKQRCRIYRIPVE